MLETARPTDQPSTLGEFANAIAAHAALPKPRIELKQDNVRNGLGKLVLTIVKLLRELLERQAIRRVDAGSLTDEEIERLGCTFMHLSEEMERLKKEFGLDDEDLNLDLGPLGKLI